jgi:predicted house-cleaning noncanonical NTP pyrophosphatase (MazG superfamily)
MHQYNGSVDNYTQEIVDLKAKSKVLDEQILEMKKESLILQDNNKDLLHKLHVTYAEKEKLKLRIDVMNKNIERHSKRSVKHPQNIPPNLVKLKQQLLESLGEMIPSPENNTNYTELINEIFENYNFTKERIENLKQENFEFSNKFEDRPE